MSILSVDVPRALAPLLQPKRYKGAHGGRGGAKSHFFAEQLILRCYAETTRAACIREIQDSLKDSVRQLLIDKIQKLHLGNFFQVLEGEIRGANGSLIIFKGMQSYNAQNIKSLENFDIAWVEEAQTLSDISLRLLRPTIRKVNSEIWFSWNPRYETDAVDAFFRGAEPHPDAIVVEVNWSDNPWFPQVLRDEMEHDRRVDAEMAIHVWDGGYEIITEGAYYAKLIAQAELEGRVGLFPYNPALLVKTGWDLGVDDYSALWFIQDNGREVFVIDYWEASGMGAEPIVRAALPELIPDPYESQVNRLELGRPLPFRYGTHFLPHDVKVREWGGGAKTRAQTLTELGVKPINVGVSQGPVERINAVRRVLPVMHFNKTKRVMLGLSRLRRYSRKFNDAMGTYTTPVHDINSHGSDALGEWAVNCGIFPAMPKLEAPRKAAPGETPLPPPPMPSTGSRIRI